MTAVKRLQDKAARPLLKKTAAPISSSSQRSSKAGDAFACDSGPRGRRWFSAAVASRPMFRRATQARLISTKTFNEARERPKPLAQREADSELVGQVRRLCPHWEASLILRAASIARRTAAALLPEQPAFRLINC